VTQSDYSLTGLVLAAGTMALLTVLISYVSFRFPRARPLLDGLPIVVIQDGKVLEANLRRERMTKAELALEARLQQIESLDQVSWAILETSGQISFVPKGS
jgi:uncharacterized membrane protein YcaP (DUF421 family)